MIDAKRASLGMALAACAVAASACVSTAEFRKLEYEVNRLKSGGAPRHGGGGGGDVADLGSQIEWLREEVARLSGRVEVVEHQASEALEASRSGRSGGGGTTGGPRTGGTEGEEQFSGSPEEVQAYRDARAAWRANDHAACI